jgi:hypothetical protein
MTEQMAGIGCSDKKMICDVSTEELPQGIGKFDTDLHSK